ncbi:hypothetical protein [Mucilaginibacter sp. CSA2-8R]|uniref:hypothetical protein n=1 Tax=Mucilaginibacter sp. CSA2-8R TaxID=3141542 RepID=UPI00315CEE94
MINKQFKITVIGYAVLLTIYVVSGAVHSKNKETALKNGIVVNAVVAHGLISNGTTILYLQYSFDGKRYETDYSVPANDTTKTGDTVKLLIAKDAPGDYYQIVGQGHLK